MSHDEFWNDVDPWWLAEMFAAHRRANPPQGPAGRGGRSTANRPRRVITSEDIMARPPGSR